MLQLHRRAAREKLEPHHKPRERLARRCFQESLATHHDEVRAPVFDHRRIASHLIGDPAPVILHRQAGEPTRSNDIAPTVDPAKKRSLLRQFHFHRSRVDDEGLCPLLHRDPRLQGRWLRHGHIGDPAPREEMKAHPFQRGIRGPLRERFHLGRNDLPGVIQHGNLRGLADRALRHRKSAIDRKRSVVPRGRGPVDLQGDVFLGEGWRDQGESAKKRAAKVTDRIMAGNTLPISATVNGPESASGGSFKSWLQIRKTIGQENGDMGMPSQDSFAPIPMSHPHDLKSRPAANPFIKEHRPYPLLFAFSTIRPISAPVAKGERWGRCRESGRNSPGDSAPPHSAASNRSIRGWTLVFKARIASRRGP